MVKVVLVQGSSSIYDDRAGEFYHFPRGYLKRVQACVGDWAVFFTPVKDAGVSLENRGAYFAHAKVGPISADPADEYKFYARIVPDTFESFATPVPRIVDGRFVEPDMDGGDGKANSGVAQQAVRHISQTTYDFIISRAWIGLPLELPRIDDSPASMHGVADEAVPFEFDIERDVVPIVLNKKIRDRRFRHSVLNAYDKKCAITGWNFVNGGGRAEAEAAHIKPVEFGGNDSINNGIAMSGTVHWMFDRGLISIAEDDRIIVSRKVNDVDRIRQILNPTGSLIRPKRPEHQPHPACLSWHRQRHGFETA